MGEGMGWSVEKEAGKLIRYDKHNELRWLLKHQDSEAIESILSSLQLWNLICSHRALNCASLLLEATEYPLGPNIPLGDGLSPLHLAAQSLSYHLTDELLDMRANPNWSPDDHLAKLPLSLALEAISNHDCVGDWSVDKSIFKLFYIFCLPELLEPLETVERLASETKQVERISFRCAMNGQLVQLVALLIAAWDKVMAPFADQGIEASPIGQFILDELEVVSQQENKYLGCGWTDTVAVLHGRKITLEATWKALKILEKGHGTIHEYRKTSFVECFQPHVVPYFISRRLANACNISISPEDVHSDYVKCLRPRLKPRQKVWLKRKIQEQLHTRSTLPTTLQRSSAGTIFSSRAFHTFGASDSGFVKPMGTQLTKTTQVDSVLLPKLLPSAKMWPLLVSTAKKYLK